MTDVVHLSDHRPDVTFSVTLVQGWTGSLALYTHGISKTPRSLAALADALSEASLMIKRDLRGEPVDPE